MAWSELVAAATAKLSGESSSSWGSGSRGYGSRSSSGSGVWPITGHTPEQCCEWLLKKVRSNIERIPAKGISQQL